MTIFYYHFKCKTCGKKILLVSGRKLEEPSEEMKKHVRKYCNNGLVVGELPECCFEVGNQEYLKKETKESKSEDRNWHLNIYDDSFLPKTWNRAEMEERLKEPINFNAQLNQIPFIRKGNK